VDVCKQLRQRHGIAILHVVHKRGRVQTAETATWPIAVLHVVHKRGRVQTAETATWPIAILHVVHKTWMCTCHVNVTV